MYLAGTSACTLGPGTDPSISSVSTENSDGAEASDATGTTAPESGAASGSVVTSTDDQSLGVSADQAGAAVKQLLVQRADALLSKDRASWIATTDQTDSSAAAELAAYDSLVSLRVPDLSIGEPVDVRRLEESATGSAAPGRWQATVEVSYQLPGDRLPRRSTRTVTFVQRGADWRIQRWLGPQDVWEAWDLVGVQTARTEHVLVIGNAPMDTLVDRVTEAEIGHAEVVEVLGQAPNAIVIVPATAQQAARLLGKQDAAEISEVAATTSGTRPPGKPAGADRVVLNPEGWGQLTGVGRQVVMTHELVHVALRATSAADAPMWLSEGLAEWVAYKDVEMSPKLVAASFLDDVRRNGPPEDLPADTEFDTSTIDLAVKYQASWLAVSRIARDHGPQQLLDFYGQIAGSTVGSTGAVPTGSSGPTPADLDTRTERAFIDQLGESRAEFVQLWRAELVALARS